MNPVKYLKHAEFVLLCLLALVLPILEAPKNIALVLIAMLWIVRRVFCEPLHQRQPDRGELAMNRMMFASLIRPGPNWPSPGRLEGMTGTPIVKRARLPRHLVEPNLDPARRTAISPQPQMRALHVHLPGTATAAFKRDLRHAGTTPRYVLLSVTTSHCPCTC